MKFIEFYHPFRILFAIRELLKCHKKYLLNSSKNAKMKKFENNFVFEVRHPVVEVSNNTIVANIEYQGKFHNKFVFGVVHKWRHTFFEPPSLYFLIQTNI